MNLAITSKKTSKKTLFLILGFFLLLNFATSGGHLYSIDDVRYFLLAENLVLNNSIKINPLSPSVEQLDVTSTMIKGQERYYKSEGLEWTPDSPLIQIYTASPLLLPILTTPLYYIAKMFSQDPITILGLIPNAVILSLTSLMIFISSIRYFKSEKIAFVLSLVFLVTTFVWSYNTGMMQRPLASLLIVLGFYLIISSKTTYYTPILAGVSFGLSILASASTVLILPGLIAFGIFHYRKEKRQLLFFLIGVIFLMLVQAALNEERHGSVFEFGYYDFKHSFTDGLVGYIFSLGWGLPFNAPLLIFVPISIYILLSSKNNEYKFFGITLVYCLFAIWIFNGTLTSPHWSGYGGWGPRYFTTIMPLLIISLGFVILKFSKSKTFRLGFIGLASFGFFVSLMGKLVWYMYGYSYGLRILKTLQLGNGWERLNYDFQYFPLTLHLLTLNSDFIQNMGKPLTGVTSWGLAPCSYDLFLYCELGIIPFILILIALTIVGLFILRTLKIISKSNVSLYP